MLPQLVGREAEIPHSQSYSACKTFLLLTLCLSLRANMKICDCNGNKYRNYRAYGLHPGSPIVRV